MSSQLNTQEWEKELEGYEDDQLTQLICFSFSLDFDRQSQFCHEDHASAIQYRNDVDAYLQEELQHKAVLGPFTSHPISNAHFSPFMTREKAMSKNRCVIIDLSWPEDNSVHAGVDKDVYLGTDSMLTFPTVDHITDEIKAIGKGAHLYKIDVSPAFRHVKLVTINSLV